MVSPELSACLCDVRCLSAPPAGSAFIAVVLSFVQKFGAVIQTIPVPVMGGISMMLFGIIARAEIRTVVESRVALAALVGIIPDLVLPRTIDSEQT